MSNLNITLKNTYWFLTVLSFLFYFILYFTVLKLEFQLNSVNTLLAEVQHLQHSSRAVKQQEQKWLNVKLKPLEIFQSPWKKNLETTALSEYILQNSWNLIYKIEDGTHLFFIFSTTAVLQNKCFHSQFNYCSLKFIHFYFWV